jgi:transcriptional regulator with XRE-family HTH domain
MARRGFFVGILEAGRQAGCPDVTIDTMDFATKIQTLCRAKGWNKADLARMAGVSKNTAGRWWEGEVRPYDPDVFTVLGRLFGLSLDYLANDDMDAPHPGLSQEQERILWLANLVGHEEAMRRLAAANAPASVEDHPPRGARSFPAPIPGMPDPAKKRRQG